MKYVVTLYVSRYPLSVTFESMYEALNCIAEIISGFHIREGTISLDKVMEILVEMKNGKTESYIYGNLEIQVIREEQGK